MKEIIAVVLVASFLVIVCFAGMLLYQEQHLRRGLVRGPLWVEVEAGVSDKQLRKVAQILTDHESRITQLQKGDKKK